ncbi:hypothetical protein C1A50_3384 [Paenibacillus polymyxa]|nr:hypothetical protein C1A50_3384 [Paenibacillus polymyxa]
MLPVVPVERVLTRDFQSVILLVVAMDFVREMVNHLTL